MTAPLSELVADIGFRPHLRSDLQFRTGATPDVVLVIDPARGPRCTLTDFEHWAAQQMTGERDMRALLELAQERAPSTTSEQLQQLALKLAELDLLADAERAAELAAPDTEPVEKVDLESEGPAPPRRRTRSWGPRFGQERIPFLRVVRSEPSELPPEPPPPAEAPPAPVAPETSPAWQVQQPPWYKRKRVRRWLVVGAVLGVLAAISAIPYPLYITEECVVSPIERAEVRSQIRGIIAEVFVREGDQVAAGTPLVRLDDRDLTYPLKQAKAEADRFTANLAKVRGGRRPEEIRAAQANVEAKAQDVRFAEIEAQRQQGLFDQGVASAMARDEARRDLEVKRAAQAEAQAGLRLVQAGSREEEIAVAEAELRKVQAEIEFLEMQMGDLIVRSPIAGRVLTPRIHERLHARLEPGDTVCEVGNGQTVRVDIFVPESDADIVRVGHPVSVKVKAYPLEAFTGHVSLIAPAVEEVGGQRIIRVETVLENHKDLLRPRMSGYAEIDTGKRPLIVRVFRRALRWLRVRFLL